MSLRLNSGDSRNPPIMVIVRSLPGRLLTALGAIVLVVALALTWYRIARPPSVGAPAVSGWDVFTHLRIALVATAGLALLATAPAQHRAILALRTLAGLVAAGLVIRRIVDPPQAAEAVRAVEGVYVAAVGAALIAVGGLLDSGRWVAANVDWSELVARPRAALPPGREEG